MSTTQTSTQTIEGCSLALDPLTLSAWRDGALDAEETRRVGAHVASCDACQARLAQYDAIGGTLRAVRMPEPIGGYGQVPALPARRGRILGLVNLGRWGQRGGNAAPHLPTPLTQLPRPVSTLGALAAVLVVTLAFAQVLAHLGTHPPRPATTPSANVTSAGTATPIPRAVPTDIPTPTAIPAPPLPDLGSPLANVAIAVHNRAFVTPDGGATWQDVTPSADTSGKVLGAQFANPSVGWVAVSTGDFIPGAGYPFTMMRTADGGQSWTRATSLPDPNLLAPGVEIDFVDTSHGWLFVGQPTTHLSGLTVVLRTEDGGLTWMRLPDVGLGIDNETHFITPTDGGTAGGAGFGRGFGLVTHDGGQSWHDVALPDPPAGTHLVPGLSETLPMFFIPQDAAVARTTYTDGSQPDSRTGTDHFYLTHDGGATWNEVAQFPATHPDRTEVDLQAAVNGQEAWVLDDAHLYQTHDGGQTWSQVVPSLPSDYTLYKLTIADGGLGWAMGFSSSSAGISYALFRTSDDGKTWQLVALPGLS